MPRMLGDPVIYRCLLLRLENLSMYVSRNLKYIYIGLFLSNRKRVRRYSFKSIYSGLNLLRSEIQVDPSLGLDMYIYRTLM